MLYYRFDAVAIDFDSQKDLEKHCQKLTSFTDLAVQLDKMKYAFNNAENVRADVIVNALPCVDGIAEIAVYHKIKSKLFSRQVKSQCLCMVATHVGENITLYTKETQDFAIVESTLKQFVQEGKAPVFVGWQAESMERAF